MKAPALVLALSFTLAGCGDSAEAKEARDKALDAIHAIGNYTKQQLTELSSQLQSGWSDLEGEAQKRVHLGMLVSEVIEGQQLKVEDDEVRDTITKLAGSYEDPQEVIDYYMNNPQQRQTVENLVLENKVVDWVVGQVKVNEEKRTFSDVMNKGE